MTVWDGVLLALVAVLLVVTAAALLWPERGASGRARARGVGEDADGSRSAGES
ncbi:hypothetical protein [Nocardia cyriacigeorgica]|uniref:hypothetical protein n=1 Tax=Nocardia cyriacigeorgica TaxID=135487 RepID=UPI00245615D0|nr:hypothetical protein [Nocardia cyriacigeorgica]